MWRGAHRRFNRVSWAAAVAIGLTAVLFIIPSCSKKKKSSGYFESLAGAKHMADETACRARLAQLGQGLLAYAALNDGRFPASLDELAKSGVSREFFQCPKRPGQSYVYLPGQNQNMPSDNILVLEEQAVHRGRCNVLRLGGMVESLTPEEVAAARAKTQRAIGADAGS
ncbi:MAG: hypothetical protein AMJ81_09130 [Phycisphaerae bacterium SM23_33]|jgi:hypothetical protein|nr:MAG: hypothetical protein AMJ81_09130 [Phycisphaerae bacterium SM23_33]